MAESVGEICHRPELRELLSRSICAQPQPQPQPAPTAPAPPAPTAPAAAATPTHRLLLRLQTHTQTGEHRGFNQTDAKTMKYMIIVSIMLTLPAPPPLLQLCKVRKKPTANGRVHKFEYNYPRHNFIPAIRSKSRRRGGDTQRRGRGRRRSEHRARV